MWFLMCFITGDLYFGIRGGRIVKSTKERKSIQQVVTNISSSPSCLRAESEWDQNKCGRVLGVRVDSKNNLYVIDAQSGVKKVDVLTGKVESIYRIGPKQAGRDVKFIDDFAIVEGAGKKGGHVFYITDSTALGVELLGVSVMTRETSGRVIRFDSDTKEISVVSDEIALPTGIELMDDGKHLLVSEGSKRNLLKININTGKKEVLLKGLPGYMDNIRRSSRKGIETYWIALFQPKAKDDIVDQLLETPNFTKAVLRMVRNLGTAIMKLGELSNCAYLQDLGYQFRSMLILSNLGRELAIGIIVEVDSNGSVLRVLQDPRGIVSHLSEVKDVVEDGERVLYLGSYFNPFLGRLVLKNEAHLVQSAKKSSTPTTTTTRRPPTEKIEPLAKKESRMSQEEL
jgi:sugar lactone lactonase YvrE